MDLQTVPTCQNLYKNSFIYHSLKEDKTLPFDECLEFIGESLSDFNSSLLRCIYLYFLWRQSKHGLLSPSLISNTADPMAIVKLTVISCLCFWSDPTGIVQLEEWPKITLRITDKNWGFALEYFRCKSLFFSCNNSDSWSQGSSLIGPAHTYIYITRT
jgi:hypothetical protein